MKAPPILLLLAFALLAFTLFAFPFARPVHGQLPPEVEVAQRLQEAGAYAAAADTLRPYLERFPDDTGTRWLFSRLLHWAGELAEARSAYEGVLALTPEDPWLQLEYGRLLMELRDWGAARTVLSQVAAGEPPEAATEAEALLGTLAYWEGDLTEAVERFQRVLERRPTHAEAGRQLREIRSFTRPWTRITLGLLDDDQPYRRYQGALEGGFHLTPLWSLAAGADPRILDSGRRQGGGDAWGRIRGFIPALHAHLSARGGRTVQGDESSWIGGAKLGFSLPGELTLAASAGRTRYLWTLSSADTLVMVSTAELKLDRADAPGWAGEASLRREEFADDNRVTTAYAWILAPLLGKSPGFGLRLGYAFSWSDARESRWTARAPGDGGDPGTIPAPGATIPGLYTPYFTPNDVRVHNALGEVAGKAGPISLRLNGSLGLHARDLAPVLIANVQQGMATGEELGTLYFYERSFTPWRVTVGATLPVSDALTLNAQVEAWETAYYEVREFAMAMAYRFGSGRGPADPGPPAGRLP